MDVIFSPTPFVWVQITVAMILLVGPGVAFYTFGASELRLDRTDSTGLSLALALAFWPILLAWTTGLGMVLSPATVFAVCALGWVVGAFRLVRISTDLWLRLPVVRLGSVSRLALWTVLLATTVICLLALRGTVAALGSDGYHHTLYAESIIAQGGLPQDLAPLTPLASFSYHYGFHTVVAVIAWLTGLPVVLLVPILGQILKAAAALSAAFLTQSVTRSRVAALCSAAIVGLIAVFPAYYVNWGRNTQLTGLILLSILLALLWRWLATDQQDWPTAGLICLLAAGLAVTHYRVTVMAALGAALLIGEHLWANRTQVKKVTLRLSMTAVAAAFLVIPWVWHIARGWQQGYPVHLGEQSAGGFHLARLGTGVVDYPTNVVLLVLLTVALVWGWQQRRRFVIFLTIWSALLMFMSQRSLAGIYMDTVTVFTSLFLPVSVICGWAIAEVLRAGKTRRLWLRWAVIAGFSLWVLQGAVSLYSVVEPGAAYVKQEDMLAMAWIKENTPQAATFMVNTFHFDFAPKYVIGSDAGFWLPVLAHRRTVTAPMTYPLERNIFPDYADRISALDQLDGELTHVDALTLLAAEGVTHVYIGSRGGPISPQALLESPHFALEYQGGDTYVFRFEGADSALSPGH